MMWNPLQLLLAATLFASAHSIFCSYNQDCSGGRICIHNQCRKVFKPNQDCNVCGVECPRGYCCMLDSSSTGTCVRKLGFRLIHGDYCQRQPASRGYCQCQPGLVCAKNVFQFFPEAVYTCQEIDTEGDCSEDDQCSSDRCCSSSKCKPKKREGEECFPRNGKFWQAYVECRGYCVDGTTCTRDSSRPGFYYTCQAEGSNPERCPGS